MPTANQDQSQEVVVENLVRYKVQSQVNLKNISDLFCSFPAHNGNYDNISNAKTRLEGISILAIVILIILVIIQPTNVLGTLLC